MGPDNVNFYRMEQEQEPPKMSRSERLRLQAFKNMQENSKQEIEPELTRSQILLLKAMKINKEKKDQNKDL